jgi:hypothetical protein
MKTLIGLLVFIVLFAVCVRTNKTTTKIQDPGHDSRIESVWNEVIK